MSKKITLENVDSSELPEIPVIGEVKQIRFTQDMELVSTLADSDLFMVQVGADLEARPNTITFDLIIKNLSGPIEEGSKKFVTGDMMFKVIGDMNLLDTWDNTNIVSSLNATYVNVRRIEEELRREINRSTGKDEQHDEQIANLRQDLTSTNELLNQEINRSVAKDKEHDELLAGLRDDVDSTSDKLDAEIDRSTAKDAEHDTLLKRLRVDVNANKSAIDSEVARSTARDEAHDAAIAKNASDITTEVNRAKAEEAKIRQEMKTADTNLQNAITAETERATGVEEDLQQQITDLSGSTDDRLEALEALSHEQNTDTGTTSKTFVIDSGNTGAMLKAEGGGMSARTKGDAGYANFTVQNLVIKGDVTQEGDTFITQAERVEVRDNMILINEGETGAGVTAGFAGIEVDRGTEQNFMFGFNESDGMFKIGKEGNMFDVALRQPVGDMTDGMFASWDAATKTFKTTNVIPYNKSLDFEYDPEIYDVALKMKLGRVGLELSMSDSDDILALTPGVTSDEVKYSLISTNTNGIIFGDYSNSSNYFILDIEKFSFINTVLDKNVIMGGKNAYFSYYSHRNGSPNTITASCEVKAPSFYRASDSAEVLYAVDPSTLTDGMFLSWDKTNKKVVTTNKVPIGKKLYIAYDHTYITEGGSDGIEFNTRDAWLRVSTGSVESRFVSSANWFLFEGNISTTGKITTTGTNLRLENKSNYLSIGNGASTMNTTLKATTFYRSSDDSEVLYQADLKSVLTGKETNYAPTVKAVSDAIDAVNTGTTESLKGYLKLSGGTMTGDVLFNNNVKLKWEDSYGNKLNIFYLNENNHLIIGNNQTVDVMHLHTKNVDIIHNRYGTNYKIWDAMNLPDPATKSGNNAFTGINSFVAGNFSVGSFMVSSSGSFGWNGNVSGEWARECYFYSGSSSSTSPVIAFGGYSDGSDNTINYAFIRVDNDGHASASYKFRKNKLTVPTSWTLEDSDGYSFIYLQNRLLLNLGNTVGTTKIRSGDVDLIHRKGLTDYKIWDASNLPTPASTTDIPDVSDMAKKSETNTFTANNIFTAGQFSVGSFMVSSSGSFGWNGNVSGEWARECYFYSGSSSSTSPVIAFGGYSDGSDNTINYAFIRVDNDGHASASYKFRKNKLTVPTSWTLEDSDGYSFIYLQNRLLLNLGNTVGTTKIRSGAVDLLHSKGGTDYKILDESNYSQYLPTTSKWTYGFVGMQVGSGNQDLNTILNGDDNIKALLNYYQIGALVNAPNGMSYGSVFQLYTNAFTSYGSGVLKPQIAFDVNHNVEGSTRYMYFRTPNNLGYGDSSNWKRVVTADENVAALVMDVNTYPSIARIDGTTYKWLRTPTQGLLPNTQVTLDNGGISYLGTRDWSFQQAYIASVHANRYYFGNTGTYLSGDTEYVSILNNGVAKRLNTGSLLVSSNYGDSSKVPTNGIFSSGRIRSNTDMLVGYSDSVTDGQLGYGINYGNTFDVGLGSEYSSGAMILYKSVNPNIGSSGYNVPVAGTVTPCYLKLINGTLKLGVGANKAYTAGEAVTMTEYKLATLDAVNTKLGSYLPLAGGTMTGKLTINTSTVNPLEINYTNASANEVYIKIQRAGTALAAIGNMPSNGSYIYNYAAAKYLFVRNDGCYFGTPSSNAKLLTTADNVITAVGGENYVNVSLSKAAKASAGAAKFLEWYDATPGWYNFHLGSVTANGDVVSTGSFYSQTNNLLKYVHNSATHSAISVNKTDGNGYLMVGNYSSMMKTFLLSNNSDIVHYRSTDGSSSTGYIMWDAYNLPSPATQSWVTSQGYLTSHQAIYALTFAAGAFSAKTFTPTSAAVTVNVPTKTSHLTNDSGFLTSVPSTYATQSWVTSQGYLTSITKSMVTTALGYTPPTTNTTYSQATSSTLGLVKIGATGLASKNYAVQLNSSGQMYVAVPWTDTDTNTHYTTRLYAGASGTAANSATTSPYIKVTDDNTCRNQIRLLGGGATSVSSDAFGNITITSTNTTYGLATASSNGLMSSSQYTKLSNCIETVSATNMVTSVQVVDTIPATSSQVTGRLYLKFA